MNWTCKTHPSGRRYWTLDGTDLWIDSTGTYGVSAKTGAERGRRSGGGYEVRAPREGGNYRALSLPYPKLADAKARGERKAAQLQEEATR